MAVSVYDRWWLAAIVFGLIRFVFLTFAYPSLNDDPDAYRALAEGWSISGTFGRLSMEGVATPTAYRPPLYPWLLSWIVTSNGLWIPGVAILHGVLGGFTSVLTFEVTKRATKRLLPLAWLAGLLVALDPILVRQSSLVMTETLATFVAILIWWWWVESILRDGKLKGSSAWVIGIMLGVACLLRPSFLLWGGLLIMGLAFQSLIVSQSLRKARILNPALVGVTVGMLMVLSPWAIRNRAVMGATIWTTTHGGYTLLLANNPVLFRHLEMEGISRNWDEEQFHQRWSRRGPQDPRYAEFWIESIQPRQGTSARLDEVADDRLASQSAWRTIQRSPVIFAKACISRLVWFWSFWPGPGQVPLFFTVLIGGWYAVIAFFFLIGIIRSGLAWRNKRFSALEWLLWWPAITLIVGLTAVHALYWSNMRMRAPIVPMVVVIAVASLAPGTKKNSSELLQME